MSSYENAMKTAFLGLLLLFFLLTNVVSEGILIFLVLGSLPCISYVFLHGSDLLSYSNYDSLIMTPGSRTGREMALTSGNDNMSKILTVVKWLLKVAYELKSRVFFRAGWS